MTDDELIRYRRLPRMLVRKVRAGLSPTSARAAVVEFLGSPDACVLVLSGGPGSGKSIAAAEAICGEVMGVWVEAGELTAPPDDGGFDPDKRMREFPGCVVIDDAGAEYNSGKAYAAGRIEAAIISRVNAGRRTIVTTNLPGPEFAEKYGKRVVSRVDGDPIGWRAVGNTDMRKPGSLS